MSGVILLLKTTQLYKQKMFQRQTVHVMPLVNCSEYLLDNRHCGNHWIFKIIGFIHKAIRWEKSLKHRKRQRPS